MPAPTIDWVGDLDGKVHLIDQTKLPTQYRIVKCTTARQIWRAIRTLQVRGAPAIGIAGALGTVLGIRKSRARTFRGFFKDLREVTRYLGSARPTAVNLFWALERMEKTAKANRHLSLELLKRRLLQEAKSIIEEDRSICRAIGEKGSVLIPPKAGILTHCNAGALATADYGTALALIFRAKEEGKKIRVFVDETRPLLQGARLTTWELVRSGLDVTLICDNMAATVMKEGKVDLIVVGADRIAANGDTANKIGTYGLAVLAREHRIPFYVAAPVSTFDRQISSGSEIPIEERPPKEVTDWRGKRIAARGVKVYNPAFDVTPARYISAIITEKGIIRRPNPRSIKSMIFCNKNSR